MVRRITNIVLWDSETNIPRHAWMSYMVHDPPPKDKIMQRQLRPWEPEEHRPLLTASRSAFKTYNTYDSTVLARNLMC
jgi:hypothetical protein